jgi:hypothetical protein
VKTLTFTIDPSARLSERTSGPSVTLNLLPLFWTARPAATPQPSRGHGAPCPSQPPPSSMRGVFHARLSCATQAIRRTNHSSYGSYSISTTQNGNGTWVAAFGRRRGDAIRTGEAPVSETRPEPAEVIALADAQIEIDDRLAGETR